MNALLAIVDADRRHLICRFAGKCISNITVHPIGRVKKSNIIVHRAGRKNKSNIIVH